MALTAGQRVTTGGGRLGVVAFDNSAVTNDTHPSCITLYADGTYDEQPRATLTNVSGGWISGTGPGA